MAGAFGVDAEEILTVKAFGHAGRMNDVVERESAQSLLEPGLRGEVELDEMYAGISEVAARAGSAHSCPYFHASMQGLFDDKAADEA